ncbi:MAG: hypothetical protein HDS57_03855 [Barnesiella sp.]|nr:hypothetical protein [Barnesiella sp.]
MGEESFIYGNVLSRRREQVQRFVDDVLSDGKPRGRAHFLSNIPFPIFQDSKRRGIILKSDHIFISDRAVLKYISHPKVSKGATLSFKEFWKTVNIASRPRNVYIDSKRKNLVYVFASRGGKGKSIKMVVEPNYKYGRQRVNMVTSIGVIEKSRMKHPQFLKIK